MRNWHKTSALAGATLVLIAGSTAAQQLPAVRPPGPRPAPAPLQAQAPAQQPGAPIDAPQSTTATYGNWVVQCQTRPGPPAEKVCDMAQVTQVQGGNAPFSRVAVAQPVTGQPVKLIVQVPVNASFATEVRIQTSDADQGIAVPFARCTPGGCFAEFDLKDDVLRKFRAAAGAGKFSFADAGGRPIAVPVSFDGFAQAFDALARS
jgi:invasion protein IalB